MMDALSHGLPMVIIPGGADQPENAYVCAQAGLARVIRPDEIEPPPTGVELAQAIRDAVRDVLREPHYRENTRRLQKQIEELPGLDYTVALLETLAAERVPQPSRPATN
jgi:UDP:flavonoid glycosyltransferase YjiC (YdhE family)